MEISLDEILPLYTGYNFHFIVLGCGGTGSAFIPRLCALLSTIEADHAVSIFDADIVEMKNLSRQNFFKQDLNKNKAEVLGAKCNTMFNVPVIAYNRYIETKDDLQAVCGGSGHIPFIVGCVDTNAVRKMLHEFVSGYAGRIFWLDSGNEEYVGQVVLSTNNSGNSSMGTMCNTFRFKLPDVTYFFPDMLESKEEFASKLSCADHAISHPQAAITNVTASTILLQFVAACLSGSIDFHKVTFDAQRGIFNTTLNYKLKIIGYGNTASARLNSRIKDIILDKIAGDARQPTDPLPVATINNILMADIIAAGAIPQGLQEVDTDTNTYAVDIAPTDTPNTHATNTLNLEPIIEDF